MSTSTLAQQTHGNPIGQAAMALKERIKKLPVPMQVFVTLGFGVLLMIDLVVFDGIPLLDELLLGWLLYTGISASLEGARERKGLPETPRPLDVRDQQTAPQTDPMMHAAEAEVEALTGSPFR